MPLLIVKGVTFGTKLLIGFCSGGTLFGKGTGVYTYFWRSRQKNEDHDSNKEKLKREAKERYEKREQHLDNLVDNTETHTPQLRHRHHTHTHQIEEATTVLAAGSTLWQQEGQQLQQIVSQLHEVIEEKNRQLDQVSHQLQTHVDSLPTISNQLTQSQWLLNERQNDLVAIIELLKPLLQQLEARNHDWFEMMQNIQTLEANNSTNRNTLAKAGQRQMELVTEVNRRESELKAEMGVIKQLENTKNAFRKKLQSLMPCQQNPAPPEHVPPNPRFFNSKNLDFNATGEKNYAATDTINGTAHVE